LLNYDDETWIYIIFLLSLLLFQGPLASDLSCFSSWGLCSLPANLLHQNRPQAEVSHSSSVLSNFLERSWWRTLKPSWKAMANCNVGLDACIQADKIEKTFSNKRRIRGMNRWIHYKLSRYRNTMKSRWKWCHWKTPYNDIYVSVYDTLTWMRLFENTIESIIVGYWVIKTPETPVKLLSIVLYLSVYHHHSHSEFR
jgi:hypothetical protein